MSLVERIRAARRAHEALRTSPPATKANLPQKAGACREVTSLLDEVATTAAASPRADEVRRALRLLTVDAQYHAGLSDAEGFRDPDDAWAAYDLLEREFA